MSVQSLSVRVSVGLVLLVGRATWAESPAVKVRPTAKGVVSATATGEPRGKAHMRFPLRKGGYDRGWVEAVEFVDAAGRVTQRLERNRDGVVGMDLPKNEQYVGVNVELPDAGTPPKYRGEFRYYDVLGRLLWAQKLCCSEVSPDMRTAYSDDGSIVALVDRGEGSGCEMVDEYCSSRAPKGCADLRFFNLRGREIFRVVHHQYNEVPDISPMGRFAVYHGLKYIKPDHVSYLVNLTTGVVEQIPDTNHGSAGRPTDEGEVPLWSQTAPHYAYVFGHGYKISSTSTGY